MLVIPLKGLKMGVSITGLDIHRCSPFTERISLSELETHHYSWQCLWKHLSKRMFNFTSLFSLWKNSVLTDLGVQWIWFTPTKRLPAPVPAPGVDGDRMVWRGGLTMKRLGPQVAADSKMFWFVFMMKNACVTRGFMRLFAKSWQSCLQTFR